MSEETGSEMQRGFRLPLAVGATCIITSAAGMMDAWVYLDHGHVFANAQSGNVVLMGIELAARHPDRALRHVPSLAAFIAGLLLSRLLGAALKRRGVNSRTVRLTGECVLLVVLATIVGRLTDDVVTAWVGFIAAVQITSLSHIGKWSFNTGMTTGNLRSAVSALARALVEEQPRSDWLQAAAVGCICVAFAAGALLGGYLTPWWHGGTLYAIAALVLAGTLACITLADPMPA